MRVGGSHTPTLLRPVKRPDTIFYIFYQSYSNRNIPALCTSLYYKV